MIKAWLAFLGVCFTFWVLCLISMWSGNSGAINGVIGIPIAVVILAVLLAVGMEYEKRQ